MAEFKTKQKENIVMPTSSSIGGLDNLPERAKNCIFCSHCSVNRRVLAAGCLVLWDTSL